MKKTHVIYLSIIAILVGLIIFLGFSQRSMQIDASEKWDALKDQQIAISDLLREQQMVSDSFQARLNDMNAQLLMVNRQYSAERNKWEKEREKLNQRLHEKEEALSESSARATAYMDSLDFNLGLLLGPE